MTKQNENTNIMKITNENENEKRDCDLNKHTIDIGGHD